jgi:lysophospholipase L1-like esterase
MTDANEPSFPPSPVAALRERLKAQSPRRTWVLTGDSITHGAKWVGRERSYPEIFHERIRYELQLYFDVFVNTGLSGESTPGLLADFEWRVLRFKPDIVSVMIGMNDSKGGPEGRERFAANLREMVRRVRGVGAIPILHRTNPISPEGEASAIRTDLPAYNAIIGQVAAAEQVVEVNHWDHWQTTKVANGTLNDWLADPIHPNGAGHRQFAITFCQTLGIYDPAAFSCQP